VVDPWQKRRALFVPRNGPVATVDGLRDGVVKPLLCFEGWEICDASVPLEKENDTGLLVHL
jgi:hypothetical protein